MCELIINQDQDKAIRFSINVPMYTVPFLINGKPSGINLMYGDELLGSFDTPKEAIHTMSEIMNCKEQVYIVPGFSDYDGTKDFWNAVDEMELEAWANV